MSGSNLSKSVVDQAIESWQMGDSPDASRVLDSHPELLNSKQQMLDLAYEEYCLRLERGEQLEASTFCEGFSTYQDSFQKSLRRLIDVHEVMGPIDDEDLMEGDHWPEVGEEFLNFELLGELGKGGFARVFLAKQPSLGNRYVAVKISWMEEEAKTLGKLDHDNITPVFSVDHDPDSGLTAICMPFIGVSTLGDVRAMAFPKNKPVAKRATVILEAARRSPLVEKAGEKRNPDAMLRGGSYVEGVLHLGQQLADALALTHKMGILHRDLKPSNVLLTASGRPKLLDFNLSSDDELQINRMGGTLPYMPPEQIKGVFGLRLKPGKSADDHQNQPTPSVGPHSDIFSLGVILYELLSGKLPFGVPSRRDMPPQDIAQELLERQCEAPAPLHTLNPDVDRRTSDLVGRCLHTDVQSRPGSAKELADLLKRETSPRRRFVRVARRHKYVTGSILAVVVGLMLAGIAYGSWLYNRERWAYEAIQLAVAQNEAPDRIQQLVNLLLAINPERKDVLPARAVSFAKEEQFKKAILDFEKGAERNNEEELWFGYAMAILGNRKTASFYFELLKRGVDNVEVRNNLGFSYLNKAPAAARTHLDKAIELDGESLAPRINRAYLQVILSQADQAQMRRLRRDKEALKNFRPGADPQLGLDDLKFVLDKGLKAKELHVWYVELMAVAGQRQPAAFDVDTFCHHVARARALGAPEKTFQNALFDGCLLDSQIAPRFRKALNTKPVADVSLARTRQLIRPGRRRNFVHVSTTTPSHNPDVSADQGT